MAPLALLLLIVLALPAVSAVTAATRFQRMLARERREQPPIDVPQPEPTHLKHFSARRDIRPRHRRRIAAVRRRSSMKSALTSSLVAFALTAAMLQLNLLPGAWGGEAGALDARHAAENKAEIEARLGLEEA